MGGSRSGRHGWRGVIEQRTRLDIRHLRRNGWLTPGIHNLSYSSGSSLTYVASDDHVELRYTLTNEAGEEQQIRKTVPIRRKPCRYGGERLYWLCPELLPAS